jgi:alpha-tubulin suppressor-like RCC1 family protein
MSVGAHLQALLRHKETPMVIRAPLLKSLGLSALAVALAMSAGCRERDVTAPQPTLSVVGSPTLDPVATAVFLHGSGGDANPPTLSLDGVAPTATTPKYKDSPGIRFASGNQWTAVGTWTAAPSLTSGSLTALGDVHVWLGLKNSDDIGTRFDVRVEMYRNDTLVASGQSYCIQGITRNPDLAKQVAVSFTPFSAAAFNGTSDVLSLKFLTRIGTTGTGAFCGGHSNGVGLRLYFDAVGRAATFDAHIVQAAYIGAVTAASGRTCGLATTGETYCWGRRDWGGLGNGYSGNSVTPLLVQGGHTFQFIGGGAQHSCGVTAAGLAYCWGWNGYGQLGNGFADSDMPLLVQGGHTFQSVSPGGFHSCGLTTAGEAYCWGSGGNGRLGTPYSGSSDTPLLVQGGHTFQSLSAGKIHTCGLTGAGEIYCWGYGVYGQLGDGFADSDVPLLVQGGHTFQGVAAGGNSTCGVTTDGEVYCWGWGQYGELGNGHGPTDTPVLVQGGHIFQAVSTSGVHVCGLTTDREIYCWGWGQFGQLGNGYADSDTPLLVQGGHTFQAVSAGIDHTCGLATDHTVYCWGGGQYGQLGNGYSDTATPLAVVQPPGGW